MTDETEADAPTVDLDATRPSRPDPDITRRPGSEGAASGSSTLTGMRLGHFEVGELLGAGGMGSVWRARDLSLERTVALKLLPAGVPLHTLERFRREARAQARMSHHNVVQIYFVGEHDEQQYFAMECVDGQSLAERIAEGPLDWVDALEICLQAARGLAHASDRGLVHRDVKPANIMIGADGLVKVADFGIAKPHQSAEPVGETALEESSPDITMAGSFIGTPQYASPEQVRGEALDARADIYALGNTLYHALVGTPPFTGSTFEILQSHLRAPIPWERMPAGAPRRVRELLARMLEKDVERRFADYDELIDAMERALPQSRVPAEPPARLAAALIDIAPLTLLLFMLDEPWIGRPMFTLLEPLYLIVPLLIWRQTLGQRLAKIEVVDQHGDAPGALTLIARVVIVVGGFIAFDLLKNPVAELVVFTLYYAAFLVAGLFTQGYRLPPDLLTNTRVVHQVGGDERT